MDNPVCRRCGKVYHPKKSNRVTYCSRECYYQHRKEQSEEKTLAETKPDLIARPCLQCSKMYAQKAYSNARSFCSENCRFKAGYYKAHPPRPAATRRCIFCSEKFTYTPKQGPLRVYCGKRCGDAAGRMAERLTEASRERMRKAARNRKAVVAAGERIMPCRIFARDSWTCQLCHEKVDPQAKVPEANAPVIDHIMPISKGGTHTANNVQCAHFMCNSVKRDLLPEQIVIAQAE